MNATFTLEQAVKIAKEVSGGAPAYLYNGSMFVDCSAAIAAKIETALNVAASGGVIVSSFGKEFAFDFC